jgi:non-specific serine/threonine protein kinase
MTSDNPPVSAIVFSCDEAYAFLARGLVLSLLMQLKQICNHPDQYLARPAYLPDQSGKFERLALICEPIAERQEKALVFTRGGGFRPLAHTLAHKTQKSCK